MNDIRNIDISRIVIIQQKYIEVYPPDEIKPPVGHGLNVAANLFFYGIKPQSKKASAEIFQQKVKSWVLSMPHTRFTMYNHTTQTLQIRADHF